MKLSIKIIGLLQSSGLLIYVSLFAFIVHSLEAWFPDGLIDPALGMVVFLLVFVFSALISASLILGYPAMLFLGGEKKKAIETVIWSAVWILVYLLIIGGGSLFLI